MTQLKVMAVTAAVLLIPSLTWPQQPVGGLGNADFRITVLDGEDGVNIIKKKTAVKPVIEVKDKNNLPIAGVAVVIGLGAAGVFDTGSHEATVTTNANGIATAPEFRPVVKGSFEISVRATYQGQTATAAIHQTNFVTVADALKAGKTPGSPQANNATQSNFGPQQASSAASGGGHGALVAVLAVGGAAAGVGAAYAAGVLGKKSDPGASSTSGSTTAGTPSSACNVDTQQYMAAYNSVVSTCGTVATTPSQACITAINNAATVTSNACGACAGSVVYSGILADWQSLVALAKELGVNLTGGSCH